ncbi:MAG: UDP-N-acetylmuramoyl-tripeptide--D-alanyl-D-alanine ligase, partial [Planctomycetaceae bacterium]|nr:UDP-N-acetylmuramoyl-tripeptide--D-alanyl-D-alanine ligase [Planctomycetaceae bacterium]
MQPFPLQALIDATGGTPVGLEDLSAPIDRIETDSRRIQPGDLFWALKGNRHNGHKFARNAIRDGAALAIVDTRHGRKLNCPRIEVDDTLTALWQFANWYRKQFDVLLIGVTGSVGKTTTRHLITSVLSSRFRGMESPHNYNNQFGVPLSLLQIEADHEFAVIELGASRSGDIETLTAIAQPEIGVITAIGPAHLDGFQSVENIIATKGALLENLSDSGFAVLNGDDRNVRNMADRSQCPVILVGEREDNDLQATEVAVDNGWLGFRIQDVEFRVPATGKHHVTSALIAVAIGRQIGMTDEEIIQGLRTFTPLAGRCQTRKIGPWTVIDDTYNANPRSMSAACQTLKDWQTPGSRILVIGDMLELGEWSDDFHRLLGEEIARSKIEKLIVVGSQAANVARNAKFHGMDAGCL